MRGRRKKGGRKKRGEKDGEKEERKRKNNGGRGKGTKVANNTPLLWGENGKARDVAPTRQEVKMAPLPRLRTLGAVKNTCDKIYCFELIRILMQDYEVSVFEMKS